jgi:hypothetical protein
MPTRPISFSTTITLALPAIVAAPAVEAGGRGRERADEAPDQERAQEPPERLRQAARREQRAPPRDAGEHRDRMQAERRDDPDRLERAQPIDERVYPFARRDARDQPAEQADRDRGLDREEDARALHRSPSLPADPRLVKLPLSSRSGRSRSSVGDRVGWVRTAATENRRSGPVLLEKPIC